MSLHSQHSIALAQPCSFSAWSNGIPSLLEAVCEWRGSVFCDINDRLCEITLDLLDAMMPTGKTSKKTAAKVFNTMYDWLEDNWNWAYLGKSECLVHGIFCPTWPLDTSRLKYSKTGVDQATTRQLVINTSGMTCTGWSAASSRQCARRKDMLSLR